MSLANVGDERKDEYHQCGCRRVDAELPGVAPAVRGTESEPDNDVDPVYDDGDKVAQDSRNGRHDVIEWLEQLLQDVRFGHLREVRVPPGFPARKRLL